MSKIFKNKKILRIVLCIFVILSMFIIPSLLQNLLNSFFDVNNEMLSTVISSALYTILMVLIYLKEIKEEFIIFKNNLKSNLNTGFKYWTLGLLLMIVSNVVITLIIFKGNIAANESLIREEMMLHPILTLVSAVLLAPIMEEIIFRKSLDKIFKNPLTYIILSGILFGFVHTIADLSSPLNLLYIIPYGSLGAMFALMNFKTKTIFTSMIMHMVHNLFVCSILLLAL